MVATGTEHGTVELWRYGVEAWQAQACAIANRNLTADEWQQYLGNAVYHRTCPSLP